MRGRHLQRALALAVLCSGGIAQADETRQTSRPALPDALEITEEACLTRQKVGERLVPLLAATELPDGLRIALRVDPDGKATFEISVGPENVGVRSFDVLGLTCENKLKVVSLAIALAIEGIVESRAQQKREPLPVPPPRRDVPKTAPRVRSTGPRAIWNVGVGQGLFTTSLGSSATFLLGVTREASRFGVRASLLQTLGSTVDVAPGSVRYSLTLGQLQACADLVRIRTVTGRACALSRVGSFNARGTGFFSAGSGRSLWIDAGAAAEASFALSRRWAVRSSIAPSAVLRGPTLRVTDARSGRLTSSMDTPRIGLLLGLELAYRFDD